MSFIAIYAIKVPVWTRYKANREKSGMCVKINFNLKTKDANPYF